MTRPRKTKTAQDQPAHPRPPTFLLELPLWLTPSQAKRLRAHLKAARQFYNAILSEGQRRLRQMRADPGGLLAPFHAREKLERARAFGALRQQYGASRVCAAQGGQSPEVCAGPATTWMRCWRETLATRASSRA